MSRRTRQTPSPLHSDIVFSAHSKPQPRRFIEKPAAGGWSGGDGIDTRSGRRHFIQPRRRHWARDSAVRSFFEWAGPFLTGAVPRYGERLSPLLPTRHPKSGEAWFWGGADKDGGSARIINLLTQEPANGASGVPGKATLHNVNHALKALAKIVIEEKLGSLALPRLATGVGGLEWASVQPLIEGHLNGLGIPIILYTTYCKGVQADEALSD